MKNHGTKPRTRKARHQPEPPPVRRVGIPEILVRTKATLREIAISAGLQVLKAMLEEDREALCGPR